MCRHVVWVQGKERTPPQRAADTRDQAIPCYLHGTLEFFFAALLTGAWLPHALHPTLTHKQPSSDWKGREPVPATLPAPRTPNSLLQQTLSQPRFLWNELLLPSLIL